MGSLPRQVTMIQDTVTVQYLLEEELDLVPSVLKTAADNEYNVGIDEFDDNEEHLDSVLSLSNIFTIKKLPGESHSIIGLILISPSCYWRGWVPAYGQFTVILTPALNGPNPDAFGSLAAVACDLALDIRPEYVGIATSVFTVHTEWLVQLREMGFDLSACIPRVWKFEKGSRCGCLYAV